MNKQPKEKTHSNLPVRKRSLNRLSWIFISVAMGLLVFAFMAPIVLTHFSFIDLSRYGGLGDTLGGIMNPFIAAAGVITTFLAFLMQVRANEQQRELFNKQIQEERTRFQQELMAQQKQDREAALEQRFYEMLRLHKENVGELTFMVRPINQIPYEIEGRKVFVELLKELKVIYAIVKNYFPEKDKDFHIALAYELFFQGVGDEDYEYAISFSNDPYEKTRKAIIQNNLVHRASGGTSQGINGIWHHTGKQIKKQPHLWIGEGHSSQLGHYFRHLFQTVKYVAKQDEDLLSYEEKRSFLRTLRAQLSNEEQAILFFNSKSMFGKKWNSEENKFFTDYRMIHNLSNSLLFGDFVLEEEFDLNNNPKYRIEKGRHDDYLFEFEEGQKKVD